jgi:hypothetical protein
MAAAVEVEELRTTAMFTYKFCKALGGVKMDLRFLVRKDISSKRKRRCEGVGGPVNGGVDICEERFPEDAS